MKFLLYVPPYHIGSDIGGSHVHITKLVEFLNRDQDVTVVCRSATGFEDESVDIHQVKAIDVPGLWRISLLVYSSLTLLSVLLKKEIDVVYTRNNYHSVVSRFISYPLNINHVVEINGFAPEEQELDPTNSIKELISVSIWRFIEWSFKYSDHIIAVTENIKNKVSMEYNVPEDKISVINNGADIDLFSPSNQTDRRSDLNLKKNATYLCFVGRLTKWQGIEYVIRSLAEIIEQNPTTQLLIVGDGPLRETLEKIAIEEDVDDHVNFVGRVAYERVPDYIGASDVCVVYKVPLESGYSPLKLYEYMACGRTVVASDVPGFRILEEINAGTLAEPKNPIDFSNTVKRVLNSDMEKMGANGRKYVVQNHSWKKVTEDIISICEGLDCEDI